MVFATAQRLRGLKYEDCNRKNDESEHEKVPNIRLYFVKWLAIQKAEL